jgi:hypothetical protein
MNVVHRGFAVIDAGLSAFLPEIVLIVLWGCVAGAAAMLLYRWTSNQKRIREAKHDLAHLRARMLSPGLPQREVMSLSIQNLKGSFGLLGRVIIPSLLSVVPVLLIASWLHTGHCCRALIAAGPQWMRGWEFPYFAAIFLVALALKIRLKIQ